MKLEDFMIPCMSKKLFGLDCPGCGMQRSFAMLLRGEFADAFYMFPAIYTTIPLFIFIGLHFIDKNRNYTKLIIPFAVINALIMIIAYFYKLNQY
ncbi:DUF2752 domain-containing protein [Flavobacterium sp.]|uniref:DUF2752 domain-containing protein n=1 Tax=Flavobacterium sp. TaxID=239 RepID=UPI0026295165|nr:DUF2752 domain-containing protein [Flavobacterium sp.]MDD3003839.1 DUF2752 domain-containing protein [Flavobacterium sp.]